MLGKIKKGKKMSAICFNNVLKTKPNEQLEKMTNQAEKLSEELESHDLTKFSAYEDLKELLIQKGIKEDEIAFIHDYDTEKKALELNRKINDGEIRVLLGSTKKMGAGSNFQERLAAIHNLDLDWTPANMEQRLGRIERQGNLLFENIPNFEAKVFNYLTKEMSDSLMLQVLSRKQKLIKQLQKRDISLRQLVDTSEDNLFGQLQAASSPYAKQLGEIFSLQNEVSTLENALKTNQSIITSRTNYINKTHKELEKIARQKEFLNRFENTKGSVLEVGGKSFDFDDKEAIKAINDALYKELTGFGGGVQEIATLKGFKIIAKEYPYSNEIQLFLGDTLENAIAITQNIKRNEFSAFRENKTNFVQRFNNVLKTKPKEQLENAATKAKDELAKAQKVLDEYKNKDLSDEKRQLNDKLARLDELNLYVGRVDKNSPNDATLARLEARYGKEYHEIVDIVREKIDKENADEVLDISFAPKRSDESALGEKAQNLGIMSAENLEKGQNLKLNKIVDSNGNIDEKALRSYAENMPKIKFNNTRQFKEHFQTTQGKFGFIDTPYKTIKVNMPYAYTHFYQNTNNKNRNFIKSAFFATFKDPLFIAKNSAKGRDSVYFYKPFLDEDNNILSLFGIGIDGEGKIEFKTFYHDDTQNRIKEMLNLSDENIIYVKE